METGGSKPHSQGLPNNTYPEPNQHSIDSFLYFIHKTCKGNRRESTNYKKKGKKQIF